MPPRRRAVPRHPASGRHDPRHLAGAAVPVRRRCRRGCATRSIDTASTRFVVIGGDGTLGAARELFEHGFPVVGVPKTIDNDIGATEMTFGFDTAVQIATDAIDRLHTTAESHDRVMVVEVMGRHAGHIAVWAGIAGGATITLIPEEPFDIDEVCATDRAAVTAVGASPRSWSSPKARCPRRARSASPTATVDEFGHVRLGGIGNVIAQEIEARTGIETRVTILGHVQRGGTPHGVRPGALVIGSASRRSTPCTTARSARWSRGSARWSCASRSATRSVTSSSCRPRCCG